MEEQAKSSKSGRARKIVVRVLIALVALVVLAVAGIAFMFRSEIATVASIKKVNDYPFYTMTYEGDHGIDEFIAQGGASSDAELIGFVVQHLMKGLPITIELPDLACSTFNATTSEGDAIFGRNFDLSYSRSMLCAPIRRMATHRFPWLTWDSLATVKTSCRILPLRA